MDIQAILQQMGGKPAGAPAPSDDQAVSDTSEQILISSLALLKMLKHTVSGTSFFFLRRPVQRGGVPFEVMGLALGEFVDEYTVVRASQPRMASFF